MGRLLDSISAVNWVMPSSRARSASRRRSVFPTPRPPGLEDRDRDFGPVRYFLIPNVAGDTHALAATWIDRHQGLVIAVVDVGQIAELSRGQASVGI